MRILHISDTHGGFGWTVPKDVAAIVHTGDLLPNATRGVRHVEKMFQPRWVDTYIERFKRHIGKLPFLFTPGNHDFVDPCPILRTAGIDAWNLHTEGPCTLGGHRFYGFPFVPEFGREWNYELGAPEMWAAIARLKEALDNDEVDVIAAHSPIYGVLDRIGIEHAGSPIIRQVLEDCRVPPTNYLHGHIHEAKGQESWIRGIEVSNAATSAHVIDLG